MKKRLLWKQITALVLTFFLFLQGCAGHETPGSVENSEKTETETAETQRFDACMDELFRTEVVKNTINLHYILAYPENYGITDYEVSLGDFSLEKIEETYTELEALKKKLLQFDREKLSKSQKLTYDSLMDHVDTELSAKDLLMYTEFLSPTTGYQAQLPVILAEYRFRTERDIEDYLSLISQTRCARTSLPLKKKSRGLDFLCQIMRQMR